MENICDKGIVRVDADRPIENADKDRFGFARIAENLAKSVTSDTVQEGIVIGIEGAWGSGKSSLLQLLCSNLRNKNNLRIIKFDPWIVGKRDELVRTLIQNIIADIKIDGDNSDTVEMLSRYLEITEKGVSLAAQIISLTTGNSAWEKIVEFFKKKKGDDLSLADLKHQLENKLRNIAHKFVVVIDDVDRLEPQEAAEVVRLIRAVGDFPNITYLLCYDKEILAHSLQVALSVEDGKSFLQKIIQVSFPIPHPQEFDLRRYLEIECLTLHEIVTGKELIIRDSKNSSELEDRLSCVWNNAGGVLKTPREVVLVLNALKLFYPPISDRVDFVDLCWLQIIRITNESLYKWIEKYLVNYASIKNEDGIHTYGEKDQFLSQLKNILKINSTEEGEKSFIHHLHHLQNFLPGINSHPENPIFDFDVSEKEDFRLGSPKHYRLYFSFCQPSGVLDDDEFLEVVNMIKGNQNITPTLKNLVNYKRPQGGTAYEMFLDRIISYLENNSFSDSDWKSLIEGIGNTIDHAARKEKEPGFFGVKTVFRDGRKVLKIALNRVSQNQRNNLLDEMFTKYPSLGWLMERIIGDELFAHGLVDKNRLDKNRQILTSTELKKVINLMLERLRGAEREKIIDIPDLGSFLWRWVQTGEQGKTDAIKWVEETTKNDEGLLSLLNKLRSRSISSATGVSYPLNKNNISGFMNTEEVLKRLRQMLKKPQSDNKRMAEELMSAIKMGDWN